MFTSIDLHSPEYAGAVKFRNADVEFTYEEGGIKLTKDSLGMNRIQNLSITPTGGDVFSVGYDYDENLLVTDLADGEESEVRITVFGR